ncbi:conjugal transfer protein TraX [Alkalicella caledoniensis]|uniref:Conjugal transfer protein TraX n=1 Tax=Alkalicella caledoniensis TaxID=2731377 RepID=A0A7G9W7D2_ALKCA|nr:TraX family protein [Alkalicella caledoniensis]QNO14594.1 conjugal transfer protein TraX [Alkalicella caledoniensis]
MGSNKNDLLKIIAIITMLIDHIGFVFFPHAIIFRIIGRISFPIFAYQIAIGCRYTSSIRKYATRLGIFAAISQIPYMLIFPTGFNIFFNLVVAVFVIDFYERRKIVALVGLLAYVFIIEYAINFGYGIYGVVMSLIFYKYKESKESIVNWFLLITLIYCLYYNTPVQFFSILAVPIILYEWKIKILLNRWWFYVFYPVHLIILFVIDRIIL